MDKFSSTHFQSHTATHFTPAPVLIIESLAPSPSDGHGGPEPTPRGWTDPTPGNNRPTKAITSCGRVRWREEGSRDSGQPPFRPASLSPGTMTPLALVDSMHDDGERAAQWQRGCRRARKTEDEGWDRGGRATVSSRRDCRTMPPRRGRGRRGNGCIGVEGWR